MKKPLQFKFNPGDQVNISEDSSFSPGKIGTVVDFNYQTQSNKKYYLVHCDSIEDWVEESCLTPFTLQVEEDTITYNYNLEQSCVLLGIGYLTATKCNVNDLNKFFSDDMVEIIKKRL